MSVLHIISIILLVYGGMMGFKNGLMKELASTLGFFIGIYIAWQYSDYLGGGLVGFLLIWILTPLVFSMAATLITKVLDFTIIGGLVNRVLGAALGVAKWWILFYCIRLMIDKVNEWKTLLETL